MWDIQSMLPLRFSWPAAQLATVPSKLSQEPQLSQYGQSIFFELNEHRGVMATSRQLGAAVAGQLQ